MRLHRNQQLSTQVTKKKQTLKKNSKKTKDSQLSWFFLPAGLTTERSETKSCPHSILPRCLSHLHWTTLPSMPSTPFFTVTRSAVSCPTAGRQARQWKKKKFKKKKAKIYFFFLIFFFFWFFVDDDVNAWEAHCAQCLPEDVMPALIAALNERNAAKVIRESLHNNNSRALAALLGFLVLSKRFGAFEKKKKKIL